MLDVGDPDRDEVVKVNEVAELADRNEVLDAAALVDRVFAACNSCARDSWQATRGLPQNLISVWGANIIRRHRDSDYRKKQGVNYLLFALRNASKGCEEH